MRAHKRHTLLVVGLALGLLVWTGAPGSALPLATAPDPTDANAAPGNVEPLSHSEFDAECFIEVSQVAVLGQDDCSDSWNNGDGSLPNASAGGEGNQWHTGVHNLVLFGRVQLTVTDGDGAEVFRRSCVWTGLVGGCTVFIAEGAAGGTWTMTLDARMDSAVPCTICNGTAGVHAWVDF